MSDLRIVNMGELADIMDISVPTLRTLLKKTPDSPVVTVGANGAPWDFDVDAMHAWHVEHEAAIAAAERQQMRLELFGDDRPADELSGRSPSERKAEIEAQMREDQVRRARGELINAAIRAHANELIDRLQHLIADDESRAAAVGAQISGEKLC